MDGKKKQFRSLDEIQRRNYMRRFLINVLLVLLIAVPSISSALEAGERAPDFEAPSTHGNVILSGFQGKNHVVLALYYADFTPV